MFWVAAQAVAVEYAVQLPQQQVVVVVDHLRFAPLFFLRGHCLISFIFLLVWAAQVEQGLLLLLQQAQPVSPAMSVLHRSSQAVLHQSTLFYVRLTVVQLAQMLLVPQPVVLGRPVQ
jgi:hypothetical protein